MQYSQRLNQLSASPIRDILAIIERPGMISFAGGLPSQDSFPELALDCVPPSKLQYGASEGDTELREQARLELSARGLDCDIEQVLILSGSQQGIDLVAKLCVDAGTRVAVESPTYLAALQVFRFFGGQFDSYQANVANSSSRAIGGAALTYAIPNFQNPSGHCYSATERADLAAACDAGDTLLFEDDPYRDLNYDACDTTPVCVQLQRAPWVYQSSFSKSFAPGLRLGFLAASSELMPYLIRLKQAADLHSNRLSQFLIHRLLRDPQRAARLEEIIADYREKRDHFEQYLRRHFDDIAEWETPRGGLFFWLKLKTERPFDTRELMTAALDQGVAFMPGEPFYPDPGAATASLRLNFSHAAPLEAQRGIEILAALIRQRLA